MKEFAENNRVLLELLDLWEPRLLNLSGEVLNGRRNNQNRTIKQITGHLIDSASNNIHRIIHLQNQPSPLLFPDYANLGNNDRWIAIQNYQTENWHDLVKLWKYSNLHIVHVISHVDLQKLNNVWISALKEEVSLKSMIMGYLKHVQLHLGEIEELINREK